MTPEERSRKAASVIGQFIDCDIEVTPLGIFMDDLSAEELARRLGVDLSTPELARVDLSCRTCGTQP